jgi:hypothetical protein
VLEREQPRVPVRWRPRPRAPARSAATTVVGQAATGREAVPESRGARRRHRVTIIAVVLLMSRPRSRVATG